LIIALVLLLFSSGSANYGRQQKEDDVMTFSADLLIDHIGQLCIIPAQDGHAQRGTALGNLALQTDAALVISNGEIVASGPREAIIADYDGIQTINAEGRLVTPGLIDSHTHLVWAGDRAKEFEQRLSGMSYQAIMAAGGGINKTVRDTRAASLITLVEQTGVRLNHALAHGTTTLECKTGYGLDLHTELAMLNTIALLDSEHPIDLIPTFLGAHASPPEYANRPDEYVTLLTTHIIPAVCSWREAHWPQQLYCDVFCDVGAFTLDQTREILTIAHHYGLGLRLHADEFESRGAVELGISLGATTVDHLLVTTPEDVARLGKAETIAVLLPATPFGLGITNTAPARALIQAGAAIALASDCNPGTAWCENLQMTLALGTRTLGLTPAQALAAVTINAAFAVGRGERIGSLEVGKAADVVIWDTADYRQLSYRFGVNQVQTVFKNGRQVYPTASA
jgi:imidazolonepropionase